MIGGVVVLFVLLMAALVTWIFHHEEPILRARLVSRLENRLNAQVELDTVHLTLGWGVVVSGKGLRITNIGGEGASSPSITVKSFELHGGPISMLLEAPGSTTAYIRGTILTIPPTAERPTPAARIEQGHKILPKDVMMLDRLVASDTTLLLEPRTPGRPPIELDFDSLVLGDFAVGKAFAYEAVIQALTPNTKLHAMGHVGPWNAEDPGEMPLDGNYDLAGLDLSLVHGVRGTLSAKGRVVGKVREVVIDGTGDAPELALSTSAQAMPLHAQFHAILNGTTSFLELQPATFQLGHSTILTSGTIARSPGHHGFETQLDLSTEPGSARVEEILSFIAKPKPPLAKASLGSKSHLTLLPGDAPFIERVLVTGTASLANTVWSDPAVQQQFDSISLRAEDHAREAKAMAPELPLATAAVTGQFRISGGNLDVSNVIATRPGTTAVMNGRYELVGNQMDFHGVLRTAVSASHMTSGIKSLLVKPFDPMFRKHGAGMELPIELKGNRTAPHLGVDLANRGRDAAQTEKVAAVPKR